MATRDDIEEWLAKCALGDRRAFDALYSATSAKLFGVALRVLKNKEAAADVTQEAYVRIWNKAGRYAVNGLSPMTWLITITRNLAIDRLRKDRREAAQSDGEVDSTIPDSAPAGEAYAIAKGEQARLNACFDELPADRAAAVRGAYLSGESYAELAARFDVPLNTMRTWLRRSLIALKECLSS